VRTLPDITRNLPDIDSGRRLLARVLRRRDVPEPPAAWRSAPETELRALAVDEKSSFIAALLPFLRDGRRIERRHLRRVYQLIAFMEMPAEARRNLIASMHWRKSLMPLAMPDFREKSVRSALFQEAIAMAGRAPSKENKAYLAILSVHLGVKPEDAHKWARFFDRLTDIENRVASVIGKRGHIVRIEDRRLEIFKKAVASLGVPAAVLFPLGTVGLSAEGIATGLAALGGGFLLPTGIAMVTGLGVAVALGVTTKKLLDLVIPTTDSDRASIDVEKLNADAIRIQHILDDAVEQPGDRERVEAARAQIEAIIRKIVPLSEADRARIEAALEHARMLGERYIDYLKSDVAALSAANHQSAKDLAGLLEFDREAMMPPAL
jgi:hypothetical protein